MDEQKHEASRRVARKIRGVMGENRCSQKELAKVLGLSQGSISNRLNGEVPLSIDELDAIAHRFDIPITDLLVDLPSFEIPCFDNSPDSGRELVLS